MNGPELAAKLRQIGFSVPIVMVTANANEDILSHDELAQQNNKEVSDTAYNEYLVKPIKLDQLLQTLDRYLALQWKLAPSPSHSQQEIESRAFNGDGLPTQDIREKLIEHAEIGHLSMLKSIANQLASDPNINPLFLTQLKKYINEVKFKKVIELLQVPSL